jgi:phospholipase C
MNGFVGAPLSVIGSTIVGGVATGYWTGGDLPFTYSLAGHFPVGDRWFCSIPGQTFRNRRYIIAGTSGGVTDDAGLPDAALAVPAAAGTIFNMLDNHGISWENYVASHPGGATRRHDHISVLAMVERKWNLPALTHRDANANDLTDFLPGPQRAVSGASRLTDTGILR